MDDVRLSLSPAHAAFVDEQVAQGHFASASDYVGALIDADARAAAQQRLDALLRDGLDGKAGAWTGADAERLERLAATGR